MVQPQRLVIHDQLSGRQSRRVDSATPRGRSRNRFRPRVPRKREVRVDHGSGWEQGRVVGTDALGRKEQERLKFAIKWLCKKSRLDSSLCNLGVLWASVVIGMHDTTTTENTEVAQRRS